MSGDWSGHPATGRVHSADAARDWLGGFHADSHLAAIGNSGAVHDVRSASHTDRNARKTGFSQRRQTIVDFTAVPSADIRAPPEKPSGPSSADRVKSHAILTHVLYL